MEDSGFFADPRLANARVAIVGLGLMGGSLALALRGRCAALFGIDPDPAVQALALSQHVVDKISGQPAEILPEANMIILAAPVNIIMAFIRKLPAYHPGAAVVMDLGSTKKEICAALSQLPERFDPLGGHPMCGKEKIGLSNASPDVFLNAAFALCALQHTSPRACGLALELVQAVGARPIWLDPATHDRWAAATSHLPYLVACALSLATPLEARPLVGPGFRSTTRVAATGPTVMQDILETNQSEVLVSLENLRSQLSRLEDDLRRGDGEGLNTLLAQAAAWQQMMAQQ